MRSAARRSFCACRSGRRSSPGRRRKDVVRSEQVDLDRTRRDGDARHGPLRDGSGREDGARDDPRRGARGGLDEDRDPARVARGALSRHADERFVERRGRLASPLRKAGAAAREMLLEAAARTWRVPRSECRAERSTVFHPASGRRIPYGGAHRPRRDAARAGGAAPQGSEGLSASRDARAPHRRAGDRDGPRRLRPRRTAGGRPGRRRARAVPFPVAGPGVFDDARARAVSGVRRVVRISTGIAVVADDTWSALRGRDALEIDWDEGENRSDSTAEYWRRLEEVSKRARTTREEGGAAASRPRSPEERRGSRRNTVSPFKRTRPSSP